MEIEQFSKIGSQYCKMSKSYWGIARLVDLTKDFTVMDIPLDHLNVYLTYENLSLREMVMHFKTVESADLSFPIIMDEDGELMDGRHRIMKALMNDEKTIKAVRFDINPEPCKKDE